MTELALTAEAEPGYPYTAKEWGAVVEPFGFRLPSGSFDRTPRDVQFIYFLQFGDLTKVGKAKDVKRRLDSFRLGAPRGLVLRGKRAVPDALVTQVERQTHAGLLPYADGREWFRLPPKDCRAVAEPIIARAWACHAALRAARFYWKL